MSTKMPLDLAHRLKKLRKKAGLTLRQLRDRTGIAPSHLSNLERGGGSPTLATLHRILHALDTNLETFFAAPEAAKVEGTVFHRHDMHTATDAARRYVFLFPPRDDVKVSLLDEYLMPSEETPEFEVLECDSGGVILSGTLNLEIEGEPKQTLCPGDAYYATAGKKGRGWCLGPDPVHMITVFVPPKY